MQATEILLCLGGRLVNVMCLFICIVILIIIIINNRHFISVVT